MQGDRGQIDQGGGSTMKSGQSGQDYSQPRWDVPKADLRDQIDSLDSFVIVGTKAGQPFVASTDGQAVAQNLLREHARDLIPQNA